MEKRKITDLKNVEFKPFDNYGKVIPGLSWYNISFEKKNNGGTFILKYEPGAEGIAHIHTGYEEFLMMKGELTDPDGKIFKKGDFVTFEPGSKHSSFSKNGCLVLVFMRGINKAI